MGVEEPDGLGFLLTASSFDEAQDEAIGFKVFSSQAPSRHEPQRTENMTSDPMHAPDFMSETDPARLLSKWFEEAAAKEPRDANAIQLATVDASGMPNIRSVLVKDQGTDGFTFYTNYESAKGRELLASRKAALLFYWKSLSRQIRVRGTIETVSDAESDAYFATRPREAQIGAWASRQSQAMSDRAELERRIEDARERFANSAVARPPYWSGFRLVPSYIEFWQERPFRLHDRLAFARHGDRWARSQLYP
jgi:pyridoxamine 5'-phosphate oxidase